MSSLPVKDTSVAAAPKVVKSLWLGDFQSHEDTKIELAGPGKITVLVGCTDSGKTSLVRALRWIFYNVPQGVEFIRVGRNQATGAVEMSDGTKVVRERSRGSVNRYRIVKPGATDGGQKLEGFGLNVPQEVVDATGVRLVKVGEKDIMLNLSEQLDGPFLGASVSSPERARILGKLAGTEEVDEAQKTLGTDIYRGNQEEKRLADEIEELDGRIGEYGWLPGLKESIEAVEGIVVRVREAEERRGKLTEIRTRLNEIAAKELEQRRTLERWVNLDRLELIVVGHVEPAMKRSQALRELKVTLEKVAEDTAAWQLRVDRWAHVEEAATLYVMLESNVGRAARLRELFASLKTTAQGIDKAEATVVRWRGLEAAGNLVTAVDSAVARAAALRRIKTDLTANGSSQAAQRVTLAKWAGVEKAAELAERISETKTQTVRLRDIKEALRDNAERQARETARLAKFSGVEQAAQRVSCVESSATRLIVLRSLVKEMTKNREAQVVAEESFKRNSQAVADAEKQYLDTLIRLGKCPLCGSTVDPKLVKEVA